MKILRKNHNETYVRENKYDTATPYFHDQADEDNIPVTR